MNQPSVTGALHQLVAQQIDRAGGWLPFDRFMALALYAPGLGYYANASRKFGALPSSGSDFVTAPEMSPLFGQVLAVQVAEALERTGTSEIWEFGAGTGALASQLLDALGARVERYTIVELSASLRERQQAHLAAYAPRVQWAGELPQQFEGVVVGNEVLDAMPVKLLLRRGGTWHERGVRRSGAEPAPSLGPGSSGLKAAPERDVAGSVPRLLEWEDRATELRPGVDIPGEHDYLTELHPHAQAFIRTLGDRLRRGAAFFIDYGFPEAEYYHPQRHMGTLMCHRAHMADTDPLADIGQKDITAHVDFTGIAVAAQESGLATLGYTGQGRFLVNCGLVQAMAAATPKQQVAAQRLMAEHEMGELFKVLALHKGAYWDAVGFAQGDRTHTL